MAEHEGRNGPPHDFDRAEPWFPIILGFLLLVSAAALVWMLVVRR